MEFQIGDRVFTETMITPKVNGQIVRKYVRYEGEIVAINYKDAYVRVDNVPVLGDGVSSFALNEIRKV